MHSAIISARFACLLPTAASAILRATTRWQELWDVAVGRIDSVQLARSGIVRHSGELCWLARKVVEISIAPGERPAYLEGMAYDSLVELHSFLRKYRDA